MKKQEKMATQKKKKENLVSEKEGRRRGKERKWNVGEENEWSRILFIQKRVQKFEIPILPLY